MAPPKSTSGASARPGIASKPKQGGGKGKSRASNANEDSDSSNPFESSNDGEGAEEVAPTKSGRARDEQEEEVSEKSIPKDLLTRILHEFFTKESTRISKDANAAVGKYVDVFVREAIARAAVEKKGGFLEVEDLEKVAPQLLLDL